MKHPSPVTDVSQWTLSYTFSYQEVTLLNTVYKGRGVLIYNQSHYDQNMLHGASSGVFKCNFLQLCDKTREYKRW